MQKVETLESGIKSISGSMGTLEKEKALEGKIGGIETKIEDILKS